MGINSKNGTTKTVAACSVVAGFLASVCCIGPLLLASLGIGSAGIFMMKLMPYQKWFTGFAVALLSAGFYFAYRKPKECEAGCDPSSGEKSNKIIIWFAAGIVLLFIGFPYLQAYWL